MIDGLYQVTTSYFCAGFIIKDGVLVHCAPILRKKFDHWKNIAKLIQPKMKVIVAGGRDCNDYELVKKTLDNILKNVKEVTIVSGACSTGVKTFTRPDGTSVCGADGLGEKYAAERGYTVEVYPANWAGLGKAAGFIRNQEMANACTPAVDGCVCFWDGQSRGTEHMARVATIRGLKIRLKRYGK